MPQAPLPFLKGLVPRDFRILNTSDDDTEYIDTNSQLQDLLALVNQNEVNDYIGL